MRLTYVVDTLKSTVFAQTRISNMGRWSLLDWLVVGTAVGPFSFVQNATSLVFICTAAAQSAAKRKVMEL